MCIRHFYYNPGFIKHQHWIFCWNFLYYYGIKYIFNSFVVVVQWLSCVQLFATPWTAAHQAPLSFTVSGNLLTFMSIESVILSNHLILCHTLLLLHSVFYSISVFSNELALHIKWPKYLNFSNSSSNPTPGTVAFQAPLSMGFPGKNCWNGLPFPSPGHLPELRDQTHVSVSPELAGRFFTTAPPGKSSKYYILIYLVWACKENIFKQSFKKKIQSLVLLPHLVDSFTGNKIMLKMILP